MIISEQWLRERVQLDLTVSEIADVLTNAGLEVDAVSKLPGKVDKLVIGEIQSVAKHPDADRLNIAQVDIGSDVLEIVCGASNVRESLKVAVALVGAKLPNGLKIKKAKVRGVESTGMLCSAQELGLEESSDGLIELGDDAQIGQQVDAYLALDDALIDIDLTPNRGDCLSVDGIARELKVLADCNYISHEIQEVKESSESKVDVEVDKPSACPSYLSRVIEGLDVNVITPIWLQERLRRSGVRPISPVVDITNYVMLELGQPMHAFDRAKINEKIIVRQSVAGEKIVLLDDSEATLDADTLVIADSKAPIAIAGVMGGAHSAIGDQTKEIVFEAAHFTRKSAAGTARRYGLHTESSHRYERGVDPTLPARAIERATQLCIEICGGQAGPVVANNADQQFTHKEDVEIRLPRLERLLGMSLEHQEVGEILGRIAGSVIEYKDGWRVSPPSYRFDIEREADLVEEVARVKGYDNIPTAMPRIAPRSQTASETSISVRQFRQSMVARDYREVITYSFINKDMQSLCDVESPVCVANPLADNLSVMRTNLLPGLLTALQFNVNRQRDRIRLFEIGASYHKTEQGYLEKQKVAGIICGTAHEPQWGVSDKRGVDFYDLKADVEAVLALTGQKKPIIFNEFDHIALHPGQSSSLSREEVVIGLEKSGSKELGWLGRLHPSIEKQLDLPATYVFELDIDLATMAQLPSFQTVSKFPSVSRDLSVIVKESYDVGQLSEAIGQALGSVLTKIDVFDVYRGAGIEDGSKSVSFRLSFREAEKTMTDADSEQLVATALEKLSSEFGAKLRA